MTAELRINLMGGFHLSRNGMTLPVIAGETTRALFAYLVIHPDCFHSRSHLAGLFWPDLPERAARRRLSQALWRIRKCLGAADPLLGEGDGLCWPEQEGVRVDVLEFERACTAIPQTVTAGFPALEAAELGRIEQGLDLYQGPFLAGHFDDWVLLERERLREHYIKALAQLSDAFKVSGDYAKALEFAKRLAEIDDLREETHREVMQLCLALGRSQEGLEQFDLCKQVLREELGLEPGRSTLDIAEQLRHADQRRSTPPIVRSPLLETEGVVSLVGRRAEYRALSELLEQVIGGEARLALVEGEPGVGKTRLLDELEQAAVWRGMQVLRSRGREFSENPPYDLIARALRPGLTPLRIRQLAGLIDPVWLHVADAVLPELASLSDAASPPNRFDPEQERQRLRDALAHILLALPQFAPVVFVVDDLQWADQDSLDVLINLVGRIQAARAQGTHYQLLVLVSYRSEEAWEMASVRDALSQLHRLPHVSKLRLQALTAEDTGELVRRSLGLKRTASRTASSFQMRLHQETGGNPLFVLETLRALHEEGLLYRNEKGAWATPWDDETADYQELPLTPEIYGVIARRLQRLDEGERLILDSAAVLGVEFDFDTLVAAAGRPTEQCTRTLSKLVGMSLLAESRETYRFSHDKIRQVVLMEMDKAALSDRHGAALKALETHQPNQLEALAFHALAGQVWGKAVSYNRRAGKRAREVYAGDEAIRFYTQALDARRQVSSAEDATTVQLLLDLGEVFHDFGHFEQAEPYFLDVRALAQRLGEPKFEIRALNRLSYLHFQRGNYENAIRLAESILLSPTSVIPRPQKAQAFLNAANANRNYGNIREAVALYEQAAELFRELGDERAFADSLNRLGYAHIRLGDYAAAERVMAEALEIRRRLGDQMGLTYSLINLCGLYHARGEFSAMRAAAQEALDISVAIGDPYGEDGGLQCLGLAQLETGDYDGALPYLLRCIKVAEAIGERPVVAETIAHLGHLYFLQGDLDKARSTLEQAIVELQHGGEIWHLPAAHVFLTGTYLALGMNDAARISIEKGYEIAQKLEEPYCLSMTLRMLGQVAAQTEIESAATYFERAIAIQRKIGARAELARSLFAFGHALSTDFAEPDHCAALLAEAAGLVHELGMAAIPGPTQPRSSMRLPHASAPTGRPLRDDEWVEIRWTLHAPNDEHIPGKTARRQHRLRRLLAEAAAQDAAPTVDILAATLQVSKATVKRDLAAMRKQGIDIRTRGSRGVA